MLFKQIGSYGKVQRPFRAREVLVPQGLIFKPGVQMVFPHVGKRKLPTEDKIQEMKLGHPGTFLSGNVRCTDTNSKKN